ncbi:NAD-dependent epimerase/dehydratase family protein [Streptomyces parvulus]|uniref:NAD-dependent epimerase/dehydratase family protein n=1 Tax=Streptomyces parvulus TaxID=146923 RepID=UPI001CF9FA3E|nr:NAD-dependent epimerase/dehydratase family protein [Streptomyces parvulus]
MTEDHTGSDPHAGLEVLEGATVLVTGGAGLIGSRIVWRLRELGARPVALCTMDAYPPEIYRDLFGVDAGRVVAGDIRDAALVARLMREADYVVHAAALADVAACTRVPQDAIDHNVSGTQTVLSAAAASRRLRRLVFVSSASVYGNGNPDDWAGPEDEHRSTRELLASVYGAMPPRFGEERQLRPLSVYANTKAFGEVQTGLVLRPAGISYSVVRYFSVYGQPQVVKPGSHSWVVAWFAARAAAGLLLHLNGGGRQVRDFVHVDDIAEGTLRALTEPAADGRTVNIGTGRPTTIRTVADMVAGHFPGTRVVETPMPPGDPLGGCAGTTLMQQVLDWQPGIIIEDGIARYVRWLKETPAALPGWLHREAGQTA